MATKGKNGGKMKFWRRMSEKQYDGATEIRTGRRLRDALRGANHQGMLLPIHIWLFKSAGISTPVFDKEIAKIYDNDITTENEGVASAA